MALSLSSFSAPFENRCVEPEEKSEVRRRNPSKNKVRKQTNKKPSITYTITSHTNAHMRT
jgi:hypothetical protein